MADRPLQLRTYGSVGPTVIVLHGGPAAAGTAAPIARGLAGSFRVLEPWQRGSGGSELSVAGHVADLDELVRAECRSAPALVGQSWGAMLALAYAAAHPAAAGPLVLVSCGSFDPVARARLHKTLEQRTGAELRLQLQRLAEQCPDQDRRLTESYRLTRDLYDVAVVDNEPEQTGPLDVTAHLETWHDMLRLQKQGIYPRAFEAIRSPVLMIHGADDPHPGRLIRHSLEPFLPQLEYVELARCGHRPWFERHARDRFFTVLRSWLSDSCFAAQ